MKKQLLTLLKVVVTSLVVYWIVVSVDWNHAYKYISELPVYVFVGAVCAMIAGWFVSAIKWGELLQIHAQRFSLPDLTRWYGISFFISQFLPSAIGGDAYRIYKTFGQDGDQKAVAFLSVFIERLTGFAALVIIGGCVAVYFWFTERDPLSQYYLLILVPCAVVGLLGLILVYVFNLSEKLLNSKYCPKVLGYLVKHMGAYKYNLGKCMNVMLLSFLFHGLMIVAYAVLVHAMTGEYMAMEIAIVLSITVFVSMLPISIGGYGVVDGAFMYFMAMYGLEDSIGIVVALLIRLAALPISLIGSGLYLIEGKPKIPNGVAS